MKLPAHFLLSLCGVLLIQADGVALQSAIRFSADGFFPEFADPATLPATAYPVEAFYNEADYGARLSQTSVGWTFRLSEAAPLEGLGVYDYGADGLLVDHLVGLWKLPSSNLDQSTFQNATLIAATLVEKGPSTPFDGQWRYSTSLYSQVFGNSALTSFDKQYLDSVRDSNPDAYWDYFRSRVQTAQVNPLSSISDVVLEPGTYALISSQIASQTNQQAAAFEDSRKIDFLHFVSPTDRYPLYDSRLALENNGAGPIGPDAYDFDAAGEYYQFRPTNVQLFPGMMVGPTLFLGVPEPTAFCLAALSLTGLAIRRK